MSHHFSIVFHNETIGKTPVFFLEITLTQISKVSSAYMCKVVQICYCNFANDTVQ